MPNTYTELRRTVVPSTTSSVTFDLTGISGYTDLVIVANGTSSGDASFMMRFNGDSASNYSTTYLYGTGSSAVSGRVSNDSYIVAMGRTNTTGGASIIQLQNYANTTTFKTVIGRGGGAATLVIAAVGLWRSTSAITSILITPESSNTISAGSTFSLYGIANADQGAAKATGGIITEDSQYWYHTFGASGTFTPKVALTCDYLVVAGGGGGSNGGGGAGGLRSTVTATGGGGSLESPLSLIASTPYTVTVGAGAAANAWADSGLKGSNSIFATITSEGGGGGGGPNVGTPLAQMNGGSGGGGGATAATPTASGGTGTTNQGYAGGVGSNINNNQAAGGGGGGAGGVGATAATGTGGAGVSSSITGFSVARAGGGGAGNIGGTATAGGGAGGSGTGGNGTSGTVNTGGGGGGAIFGTRGAGGSGIVIVRYPK
jgi:hypothetical protein